ncbi:GGDEF domain-containing protein [Flavobacterium sp.]|uniref:GGDEF domain-containing protein n=1 Tax=Flavobacterium sp. TaxID=239 RepID=UPI003752924C
MNNIKNYLTKSYEKFKQDGLSKIIYDVIKAIAISLFIISPKFIPQETLLWKIMFHEISVSIYIVILFSLFIIVITNIIKNFSFKKKYLKLEKDNFNDELTGLKNYKALNKYLDNKLIFANQNNKTLSVILIDIDNFKKFNIDEGYNTSDKILKKLGELLNNDKRATDETFRFFLRGDEFLVVANETNLNQAFQAAERKRKLIETTSFEIENKTYFLNVSCGVTEMKKDDDFKSITDRVNSALIEAKKSKNCTKTII